MLGSMMDFELTVGSILQFASRFHGGRLNASRLRSGAIHHFTYADLHSRCSQLSNALAGLGVQPGDRVGTIASNSFRHLEAYFAAPAMGSIIHTINPRLFPEQIRFIINHAADKVLLIDPEYVEIVERLLPELPSVEHVLVLADKDENYGEFLCYEDAIGDCSANYAWPVIEEKRGAALCYTSGTTGDPKGVLYTHRSIVLHSLMVSGADSYALRKQDAVLPIVPMYHVMAWSLPYACAMNGSKLVLPRSDLSSASLLGLINAEEVSLAAGVPTIWSDMLVHLENNGKSLSPLERVIVGGTAPTPSLIKALEEVHGVQTLHGWGMTETSSNGLINSADEWTGNMDQQSRREFLRKQGRPRYPVHVQILDQEGSSIVRDGKAYGKLFVSGPTIAGRYFPDASPMDEWLDTGDIATIDERGYVEIVDRDKDLIKSGGEWISSIALENVAASHPDVLEAAVISVPHPRWDERPLLVVVPRLGRSLTSEELIAYFVGKVAKWWIPEKAIFVEDLPRQATGKVSKSELRKTYASTVWDK